MNTFVVMVGMAAVLISNGLIMAVLLRRSKKPPRAHRLAQPPNPFVELSKETIDRLDQHAQAAFKTSVAQASEHLIKDMAKTSERLDDTLMKLTTSVVEGELSEYRKSLVASHTSLTDSLARMQKVLEEQQVILETGIQTAVANRQAELLRRLDEHLGTAAVQYIVETLGQEVDIGTQREYLLTSLERNKDSLKQDIVGEL